jgi:hypothetical protein
LLSAVLETSAQDRHRTNPRRPLLGRFVPPAPTRTLDTPPSRHDWATPLSHDGSGRERRRRRSRSSDRRLVSTQMGYIPLHAPPTRPPRVARHVTPTAEPTCFRYLGATSFLRFGNGGGGRVGRGGRGLGDGGGAGVRRVRRGVGYGVRGGGGEGAWGDHC